MSRSGYYREKKRKESKEIFLEKAIILCFKKHSGNYGRIRIRKELLKQGIKANEHKIARIMQEYGLKAKTGRKSNRKKENNKELSYTQENLIREKFKVYEANYLWCSDITELKYGKGKLYLCCNIDVATRRIVGWSIGKRQTKELVQSAFEMAVGRNPKRPIGAVYHSDRGCQYTAKTTKEIVERYGFRKSMSPPGSPKDNQPIESFWRTLELEMEDIQYYSYQEASRAIVKYIELYYNSERIHSGINYNVPNNYFRELTLLVV